MGYQKGGRIKGGKRETLKLFIAWKENFVVQEEMNEEEIEKDDEWR